MEAVAGQGVTQHFLHLAGSIVFRPGKCQGKGSRDADGREDQVPQGEVHAPEHVEGKFRVAVDNGRHIRFSRTRDDRFLRGAFASGLCSRSAHIRRFHLDWQGGLRCPGLKVHYVPRATGQEQG